MNRTAIGRWTGTAAIIALAAVFSGCTSLPARMHQAASERRASSQSGPPNVLVIRGTAEYWPNCDEFVDSLRKQGTPATVIRGWEINRTAERITAARRTHKTVQPLVLIGYSRGANDAIRLTRRLQEHDVAVDTLILMETAEQASVPANVASCLNIYKSSPISEEWVPAFRGLPVTVESAQTQLVNYNLRFHDEAVERTAINQFTVCQNPAVRDMIAERVALAVHPAPAVHEPTDAQLASAPREWANRAPGE